MSSIFLSHSHADKSFVRKLASDLEQAGVRVWLDEAEIKIGDSLIEKIRQGIDEMDYVGAVLSCNSVKSPWVQRELDVAMNLEIQGKHVKVLPLLLDNCEIPGFVLGKLYADFRKDDQYSASLALILDRLKNDSSASAKNLGLNGQVLKRSDRTPFLLTWLRVNLLPRHLRAFVAILLGTIVLVGMWFYWDKPDVVAPNKPAVSRKLTPVLLEAIGSGNLDQVEALLRRGADFNGQGPKGETPIMLAAQKGDQEIMDALLAKHPDLKIRDRQGRTALMYAVAGKHGRLTETLLKSGADPNIPDGQGMTAVMKDLSHNYCPSLEPLIRFGADVNAVDRDGRTALMRAVMEQREDSCVKYLLASKKVDLGIKDSLGKMALDYAVEAANRTAIGDMLEYLAESDCNSPEGLNALAVAVKLGNEYWVEKLLDQGAPVNGRTSDGFTPLMIACTNDFTDPRLINLLLRRGADKEAKTNDGRTPLVIALDHGESGRGAAHVLLNGGADVRVRDSNGKTALDYARDKNLDDLIRLIELRLKAG